MEQSRPPWDPMDDIATVLYTPEQIRERVAAMARAVEADYQERLEQDRRWSLAVISVLRGAIFFVTDLVRELQLPVTLDFIAVSAYGTSGRARIIKDLEDDIQGRDVLVVEDIIDTGLTLSYLLSQLRARQPRSLTIATLINRSGLRLAPDLPLKHAGFDVPGEFVVGYGLDYQERYRNLPFIGVLRSEVMADARPQPQFAHPSEAEFARLLDFYRIRWQYEPRTFVLRTDSAGRVEVGFSPDFYLPDFDLYVELTTKKSHLMDRKRRQIEAVMQLYPDVRVELVDRSDFAMLALKLQARDRA